MPELKGKTFCATYTYLWLLKSFSVIFNECSFSLISQSFVHIITTFANYLHNMIEEKFYNQRYLIGVRLSFPESIGSFILISYLFLKSILKECWLYPLINNILIHFFYFRLYTWNTPKYLRLYKMSHRECDKKTNWLDTDWNISIRTWLVLT